MGLFDVIDDIAERQIIKTDTGDNRIFGVVIGRVTKNYSDSMPGRVCVSIQTRDAEANVLKWARVAMPYAGDSWGIYFLPEVGDQVLLAFEQGNIERPYVIGCVGQKADDFLKKSKDEHNKNKRIVSKHGNTFQILDAEQGEGTEDKIEIFTADEAHSVTIDNKAKNIEIKDKDGKAKITMATQNGDITVHGDQKVTLQAGDTVSITMNASNGTITVNCKTFTVSATEKVSIEAQGGQAILTGKGTTVESMASLNLKANGMTKIEGKPVKVG